MHLGYILLNCDLGTEEYILEELKRIPQVKKAYVTFGAYDIIVEIQAASQEDFDKAIALRIRSISRVISTMTLKV
ncbi:MAG: Lrp/AsnC ligand binding domain-containing protein, partial [Thaumarchaeota archaeon]|nr:Lrp/AsnC ligand binding domain-containing protein [Nitrososphaerota archaeon]